MSDYETVLKKLEATPRFLKTTDINRTKEFYQSLGSPGSEIPVIHVAGTNGKGSVCNYMTAVLQKAGYRVGTYISPHLTDIRERMCLDGAWMPKDTFRELYEYVDAKARGTILLNHSEYLFLMAMEYYHRARPDVIVLETGLGGRLDITNIVEKPAVCVITRIGLDHMQYLGDTKEKIAGEKAGIFKEGVPVVCLQQEAEVNRVLEEAAEKKGCPVFPVDPRRVTKVEMSGKSLTFILRDTKWGDLDIRLQQPALYQTDNAPLAVEALSRLDIGKHLTREQILEGLNSARWPGRMEECSPGIYLDGGHNEDGIRSFIETVSCHEGKKLLVFAAASDKDIENMIHQLVHSRLFDRVLVTSFQGSRATQPQVLRDLFIKEGMADTVACKGTGEVCDILRQSGEEKIYVVGSLYLVAEMRSLLQQEND
ncbi:MAG: bifunctional folylpolyglutamate synthase/dihydrofolate synthase [Lachnospiraceae bacterium]|nr:bifunctional folylpolyglutamate synthase/dihydrofolate synthase [Lachnospiraceae bacterium]